MTASSKKKRSAAEKPEPMAADGWPGAYAAIVEAYERIKKNPAPLLFIVGTYVVLYAIDAIFFGLNPDKRNSGFTFSSVGFLIFLLAIPLYGLALADKRRITIGALFQDGHSETSYINNYLAVLGASLLLSLLIVLSVFLAFVPVAWLIPWLLMIGFVVIDKGVGPMEAMSQVRNLVEGHKRKIWGIFGVSLMMGLVILVITAIDVPGLSALAVVLSTVTNALSVTATAILYRWIQAHPPTPPETDTIES